MPEETQPRKTRRKFRYQPRSAAQWRAAAGDPRPIRREAEWLARLLTAAHRSCTLSDWEQCFALDLEERLARWGERLVISDKQRAVLEQIKRKLGLG